VCGSMEAQLQGGLRLHVTMLLLSTLSMAFWGGCSPPGVQWVEGLQCKSTAHMSVLHTLCPCGPHASS
jgi:hypothetical protein